jgi:dTDP-4-amino-4,6-dideoxygalactose transaminase
MTVGALETLAAPVPFMDLRRNHLPLADELRGAFEGVLEDGGFVLGHEVAAFEREFAEFCEVEHCVGVGSGTAALTVSLMACGIGPGDEVIVPAHTFIATALAVRHAGAQPVFCDVSEGTGLLDVNSAAAVLSERTAAILPVHLYGQACDMDAVGALAERNGLAIVEDAAQAHGARWRGKRVGSFGSAAAFSFYPSKNLGALGDGGAICTNDEEVAERARRLGNLGQETKGVHIEAGMNERLDGIQAAMLRVKLRRLDGWNAARRAAAATYRQALEGSCQMLAEDRREECVYHLFPVRLGRRDAVRMLLGDAGIGTGVHYWPAVHLQPPFAQGGVSGVTLDKAIRWSEEELSLPMFAELTEAEIANVTRGLEKAMEAAERE